MRRRRLCVVGLDGVPVGLLQHLSDAGVMPRVRERIAAAHLRSMRASLPEISSVSWTSFMTGTQAGEHGVFGFTDVDPNSYALTFPSFPALPVPTFWDRLGERGLRSVVLNQPSTYPARTIPGALVSGFVAIDLTRSVKPLHHLGPLRRAGYRIDVDTGRCRRDHDWLFRDLDATLKGRQAALWHLWDSVEWDYLQVVITGTDRLYHYLWPALADTHHPRHQQAIQYHTAVDRFVGAIFDRFAADLGEHAATERFWMLSDHGFCAIRQEVQLNAWLRRQGALVLPAGATDLTGIGPDSTAFALDPGRIYIHRADRFARGAVPPDRVQEHKQRIADALQQLRYDGEPVIRKVHDATRLYRGPAASRGPDLVALSHPGFDLKAAAAATEIFGRTDLVGMHTYDDAFLLSPTQREGDLWIGDVAELLMQEFA